MAGNVHQDNHAKLKGRMQIVDEQTNLLDFVKENDNLNAAKHGMPMYAADDSAPTRKWRAIRSDDHGRQEVHVSNVDHDEQLDFRNKDFDTGAGTEQTSLFGIALPAAGGAVIGGTSSNPVRTDPTGTTTQPISGAVTATLDSSNPETDDNNIPFGEVRETVIALLYNHQNGNWSRATQDRYVFQPTANLLNAKVTQLAKDRTVTNAVAANLKAEVTQAAKDRTVTGSVTVTPSGDMARKAHYDRESETIGKSYLSSLGAHSNTVRWTYTVPDNRKAIHQCLYYGIYTAIATATKWFNVWTEVSSDAGDNYNRVNMCRALDTAVDFVGFGQTITFNVNETDIVRAVTYSNDTIDHTVIVTSLLTEFAE